MVTHADRSNDLASRTFSKPLFALAWVVFHAILVTKFWWVSNVALVWWVYGREAYAHGMRVLPGKPTRFSNGQPAPALPDIVTGLAFFILVTFGLSLLLMLCLRAYERLRGGHSGA